MTDSTLSGGRLDRPMVPDADPSILPWKTERWALRWVHGDQSAFAFVQLFDLHPDRPDNRPWMAFCAGPPDEVVLDEWHPTAEAARAAVEEHIATRLEEA